MWIVERAPENRFLSGVTAAGPLTFFISCRIPVLHWVEGGKLQRLNFLVIASCSPTLLEEVGPPNHSVPSSVLEEGGPKPENASGPPRAGGPPNQSVPRGPQGG